LLVVLVEETRLRGKLLGCAGSVWCWETGVEEEGQSRRKRREKFEKKVSEKKEER